MGVLIGGKLTIDTIESDRVLYNDNGNIGDLQSVLPRALSAARNADTLSQDNASAIVLLNQRAFLITQRFNGILGNLNIAPIGQWQFIGGLGQIIDTRSSPQFPVLREIDRESEFLTKPAILNGTNKFCFAYLFWDGSQIDVGYQLSFPTSDELIDKLFICQINSNNGTTIDSLFNLYLSDDEETRDLLDKKAINLDSSYLNPIASTMRLSFPGGKFKYAGRGNSQKFPHSATINAIAQIVYTLYNPDGEEISSNNLDFDFNRYWGGSAVAIPSNANFATCQFIYLKHDSTFHVVLGKYEYSSLTWAIAAADTAENQRLPAIFNNSDYLYLCAIAGKANATDSSQGNPETGQVVIIPNRGRS